MASKTLDLIAQLPGMAIIHQKIPSREVGRHTHAEHEFFLPLIGEITVEANGEQVKAGPGRMLYVPPDLDHSFSSTAQGSGERVIWLIDKKLWRKQTDTDFEISSMPANSLVKELLFYLLIRKESEGGKYFIAALIESLVQDLTAHKEKAAAIPSEHLGGKVKDDRIRKALELIDENFAESSLTEIAQESGLSQRNFNRLFLQETGLAPKTYVVGKRIEKAKELLGKSKLTVTDIALEVGYNSLSKFIEAFKRFEGMLPSDYRTSAQTSK